MSSKHAFQWVQQGIGFSAPVLSIKRHSRKQGEIHHSIPITYSCEQGQNRRCLWMKDSEYCKGSHCERENLCSISSRGPDGCVTLGKEVVSVGVEMGKDEDLSFLHSTAWQKEHVHLRVQDRELCPKDTRQHRSRTTKIAILIFSSFRGLEIGAHFPCGCEPISQLSVLLRSEESKKTHLFFISDSSTNPIIRTISASPRVPTTSTNPHLRATSVSPPSTNSNTTIPKPNTRETKAEQKRSKVHIII